MKTYWVSFRVVEAVEIIVDADGQEAARAAALEKLEQQLTDGTYAPMDSDTELESIREVE